MVKIENIVIIEKIEKIEKIEILAKISKILQDAVCWILLLVSKG